jgi:two-component system sensor kinase FixL
VLDNGVPRFAPDGAFRGYIGSAIDITERKRGEELVRQVVEGAPNAMIVVNSKGIISLVNLQTEAVFGYTRAELIDQPVEMLIPGGIDAAPQSRAMGAGRSFSGRRKDGSDVSVEIGVNSIQTPEGRFTLASIIDITERRIAEREQVRSRNELAHLARVAMLGELSGSLAHELNQPLTAILSNAQAAQEFLLQEPVDLDEVRAILADIVEEDRRAREVIRRLRLLFRKGELQFESLDLNEIVAEVLKLMNSDLVNHGVTVRTELAPRLPRFSGDRVQLQQVVINLIVNASDAMNGNRSADRNLRISTGVDENQRVRLSVADSGCGIPPAQLQQIFEPFHTTKASGMGLGLAVCRTIMSAHAGEIWVDPNHHHGACFHVAFPPLREASHEQR